MGWDVGVGCCGGDPKKRGDIGIWEHWVMGMLGRGEMGTSLGHGDVGIWGHWVIGM